MLTSFGAMAAPIVAPVKPRPRAAIPSPSAPDLLPKYFHFQHDNDVIFDSDRDYSSGLFLRLGNWGALANAARALTKLWLPKSIQAQSLSAFGVTLGQHMYTPLDTILEDFLPTERPYAGWLFVGVHYRVIGPRWGLRISLRMGLVGRWSFGQDVQQMWHGLIRLVNEGTAKGGGWDFQLPNEFTVQAHVSWEYYLLQMQHKTTTWMRLQMETTLAVGNVFVHPALHLRLSLGWLPQGRNTSQIPTVLTGQGKGALQAKASKAGSGKQASAETGTAKAVVVARSWDLAFFVEGFGRVVVRNLFLDGSTFVPSHRIERYPMVGGVEFGVDWRVNKFRMRFGVVVQSLDAPYALRAYHDHKYFRITLEYVAPAG